MTIEISDLNLTDAVEAAAIKFAGEKKWQHMDPLTRQNVKQQLLEFLLPTLPHLIKQVGQQAFNAGIGTAIMADVEGIDPQLIANPYDDYPTDTPSF